ncbi:hypothetical protein HK105_207668 [Polyrhizophydium stewartii]|uniref:non-specific serine/threonine protein kinase n=1 Tax=Polyrhizophydium stewartii TaxID=2732419 RepID=A0ABR4N043_9FUNG
MSDTAHTHTASRQGGGAADSSPSGGSGTAGGATGSSAGGSSGGKPGGPEPDLVIGNYRLERTIGQGTYGKVRLGFHTGTDEKVAVKIIEKSQIQSAKQVARLQREIRFLKLLHHPHIVKVHDVIETTDFIYIIMEYAVGGELFDYIVAHKRVKEREARSFFRQVLGAVDYCHKNAVIHRDLKPENLLLDDKKNIKIIDFGFGNNFTLNGLLDTFCGSPFYAAPEMILGKKYEGPEVDMWSLGVILFALLCGHLPFDDDNMKELYKKIATGNYKCPDYLLPNARHLISRLITVDPKRRATLDEVLAHPWVNEGYDAPPPNYLPQRPILNDPTKLSKDIVNRLQIFGYKIDEINHAFQPDQDFTKPNPIRATYFLLSEMVTREQTRMRNEKRRAAAAAAAADGVAAPGAHGQAPAPPAAIAKIRATSIANLGQSLPMIDEDGAIKPPAVPGLSNATEATGSQPDRIDRPAGRAGTTVHPAREYGSIPALSGRDAASRRASTPDGYAAAPRNPQQQQQQQQMAAASASAPTSATATTPAAVVPRGQESAPASSTTGVPHPLPPSSHGSRKDIHGLPPLPDKHDGGSVGYGGSVRVPGSAGATIMAAKELFRRQSVPVNLMADAPPHYGSQTNFSPTGKSSQHQQQQQGAASPRTPNGRRISTAGKLKEDLRAVSGWFLNVSTTSSKPPDELLDQVVRVLNANGASWRTDANRYTLYCEIDVAGMLAATRTDTAASSADASASEIAAAVALGAAAQRGDGSSSEADAAPGADAPAPAPLQSSTAGVATSPSTHASLASLGKSVSFSVAAAASAAGRPKPNIIAFQIEICKVPRMNLHGIHFKRLGGGVWNYKKVCNKILAQMAL